MHEVTRKYSVVVASVVDTHTHIRALSAGVSHCVVKDNGQYVFERVGCRARRKHTLSNPGAHGLRKGLILTNGGAGRRMRFTLISRTRPYFT